MTRGSGYLRFACRFSGFSSLKTKLHRLSRLNATVPANIAGGVRVVASDSGIPGISNCRAVAIAPVNAPAVNRTGAIVGDADSTGETIAPLIGNQIFTITQRIGIAR